PAGRGLVPIEQELRAGVRTALDHQQALSRRELVERNGKLLILGSDRGFAFGGAHAVQRQGRVLEAGQRSPAPRAEVRVVGVSVTTSRAIHGLTLSSNRGGGFDSNHPPKSADLIAQGEDGSEVDSERSLWRRAGVKRGLTVVL